MRILYRYFGFEYGKAAIKDLCLYASTVADYNDPFEFMPRFESGEFTRDRVLAILQKEHMIHEAWGREGLHLSYKQFRKSYLEGIEERIDQIELDIEKNVNLLSDTHQALVDRHWRFICFAKKYDSILMWSHYAQKHTGIVLGFDVSQKPFEADCLLDVMYSNKRESYRPTETDEYKDYEEEFHKLAASKHIGWSYEEECRFIIPYEPGILTNENFFRFREKNLVSVYMGVRMDQNHREEILKLTENLNCSVYEGRLCKTDYAIRFQKVR